MLRLILSLAFFVPAIGIIGGYSALDRGAPVWLGLTIGAAIGLFIALVAGGVIGPKSRVASLLFGPDRSER